MNLSTTRARIVTGAGIGIAAVVVIGGTATAASQITAHQMATGSVTSRAVKDGGVKAWDLAPHVNSLLHRSSLNGAVYRVANYPRGGGGIATVACADGEAKSQKYTAVSGGARVDVPGQGTATEPITSSFPGRMDWSTNTPKPDRLDGWVVKFGNGPAPGTNPGDVLQVWALCVPTTDIEVQTTNY